MESLKTPLPAGALPAKEAFALALTAPQRAVSLEPTNPDHHLALARLYAALDGDLGRADAQIRLALAAYPVNAPLRYSAATIYLLAGKKAEALEQARELARLDDSYVIRDSAEKAITIERRTPGYLARLRATYLFKALEIAWRASSGDINLVKSLAPHTADAREVVEVFLEWKGIEE